MMKMNYDGLYKIISGGQTGADQGGLLAAHEAGIETGGIAPKGYQTSSGANPLLAAFGLTDRGDYAKRTLWNIEESDGTVVIGRDLSSAGSALTIRIAGNLNKPCYKIDASVLTSQLFQGAVWTDIRDELRAIATPLAEWIKTNNISILNVAGNREIPGSYSIITNISQWIIGMTLSELENKHLLIRSPFRQK